MKTEYKSINTNNAPNTVTELPRKELLSPDKYPWRQRRQQHRGRQSSVSPPHELTDTISFASIFIIHTKTQSERAYESGPILGAGKRAITQQHFCFHGYIDSSGMGRKRKNKISDGNKWQKKNKAWKLGMKGGRSTWNFKWRSHKRFNGKYGFLANDLH